MGNYTLVDTDILTDVGRNVEIAVKRLEAEEQVATVGISVVTQMELIVGCRNKKELQELDRFLKRFQIISLNEDFANKSIDLLHRYRLSHGLLIADSLIAATALVMDVAFLSKNQKDYRFIEGLKLLPYPPKNEKAVGEDQIESSK
jgi:predicted nucleic acid-binding protein